MDPVRATFVCAECRDVASEVEAVGYLDPDRPPEDLSAVFIAAHPEDRRPAITDHLNRLQHFLDASSRPKAFARAAAMSDDERRDLLRGFREQSPLESGSHVERVIWLLTAAAKGEPAGRYGYTRFSVGGWDPVLGRDLFGEPWLKIRDAVSRGDAAAILHEEQELALYYSLAPFYCPDCRLSYCQAHWQQTVSFDEGGFGGTFYGECPKGHRRALQDV